MPKSIQKYDTSKQSVRGSAVEGLDLQVKGMSKSAIGSSLCF